MKNFLLWVITLLGIAILICVGSLLLESRDALNWPQTKGQVVSSELVIKDSYGSLYFNSQMTRLYRADVQYEYTVGDGRYSSNRVTFQDKASRDLGNALKVMNKYRHQRNVMVYYNSQDPEQAILEPANIGDMTIPLMMGGLFAFLGMFALYQQSLEIKTRGIESYLYQGQSYQKQGRFNEALMEFNKIIELRPHIIIGYFSRGCLYLQEDRWDEAIADLNQAMRIDPTDPLIRFNRGNAYIGKKQYDKAWEDMQKAMDMGFKVKPEILENLKKNMNIGQL